MKCNYITIEREYGSGGTKIARRLAEECGVACYGPEILEAVSRKNHISIDQNPAPGGVCFRQFSLYSFCDE